MALLLVLFAGGVSAKTCTWIGGAEGRFADLENWSGAPASGDTLVFPSDKAVTITDSVDVGTEGLIVENGAALTTTAAFSGSGKITKRGAGKWQSKCVWTTTGGLRIEDGEVFESGLNAVNDPFGTGKIEITGRGQLHFESYGRALTSPIDITGLTRSDAVAINCYDGYNPTFGGTITSESDFAYKGGWNTQWGSNEFQCVISAPGKTVSFLKGTINLHKDVDASINVDLVSGNLVTYAGTTPIGASMLTVKKGEFAMTKSAKWGGSAIAVAANGKLTLQSGENLTNLPKVSIAEGGAVCLAEGVKARVSGLTVKGKEKSPGTYTAANLPSVISGDGSLRIVGGGMVLIFR